MPRNFKCVFCGDEDYKNGICDRCLATLPYITGRTCLKCGGRVLKDEVICRECEKNEHAFDRAYAVFDYTSDIKSSINLFKQSGRKSIGYAFADIMSKYLEKLDLKFDIIIPMPIHVKRYKERGFNQTEVLCEELKKVYPNEYRNDLMVRTKDTPHQTGLSRDNRLLNLSNAFEITDVKKIKNKKILVVDDIFTTGSTLDEVAFTLKKAGAKTITGLCLARGLVYDKDRDSERLA